MGPGHARQIGMEEENHDSSIPLFPSSATIELAMERGKEQTELDNMEQELQDALEQWWKQLVQEAQQNSSGPKLVRL